MVPKDKLQKMLEPYPVSMCSELSTDPLLPLLLMISAKLKEISLAKEEKLKMKKAPLGHVSWKSLHTSYAYQNHL